MPRDGTKHSDLTQVADITLHHHRNGQHRQPITKMIRKRSSEAAMRLIGVGELVILRADFGHDGVNLNEFVLASMTWKRI